MLKLLGKFKVPYAERVVFDPRVLNRFPLRIGMVIKLTIISAIMLLVVSEYLPFDMEDVVAQVYAMPIEVALPAGAAIFVGLFFLGSTAWSIVDESGEKAIDLSTTAVQERGGSDDAVDGVIGAGTSAAEAGFSAIAHLTMQYILLVGTIVPSDALQLGIGAPIALMVAAGISSSMFMLFKAPKIRVVELECGREKLLSAFFWVITSILVMGLILFGFNPILSGIATGTALYSATSWMFGIYNPLNVLRDMVNRMRDVRKPKQKKKREVKAHTTSWLDVAFAFAFLLLGARLFYVALIMAGMLLGIHPLILGMLAAVISSLPEIVSIGKLIKQKGLEAAIGMLITSNGFDSSFMTGPAMVAPFRVKASPDMIVTGLSSIATSVWMFSVMLRGKVSVRETKLVIVLYVLMLLGAGLLAQLSV